MLATVAICDLTTCIRGSQPKSNLAGVDYLLGRCMVWPFKTTHAILPRYPVSVVTSVDASKTIVSPSILP